MARSWDHIIRRDRDVVKGIVANGWTCSHYRCHETPVSRCSYTYLLGSWGKAVDRSVFYCPGHTLAYAKEFKVKIPIWLSSLKKTEKTLQPLSLAR